MGRLYNCTCMNYKLLTFLEYNISTASLQKGGILSGWFTTEDTSFTNSPITFLNVNNKYPVYGSQ